MRVSIKFYTSKFQPTTLCHDVTYDRCLLALKQQSTCTVEPSPLQIFKKKITTKGLKHPLSDISSCFVLWDDVCREGEQGPRAALREEGATVLPLEYRQ